ncbi:MAG: glyoxylate/hydroxypyruvate reductase A [Hyphomicrobiales bacterium]|nr:glyoxylate/hydroxypyruvate reductase A [Hyphomicrobiales bacterium]
MTRKPEPPPAATTIVPFVHRLDAREEAVWIAAIEAANPFVALRPLSALTVEERDSAPVAIVANPDPAELRGLPALRWVQSLWAGVERLVPHTPAQVAIVRMVDPQLAATMAEAVLACALYLHRDMPLYARQQRARLWRQHDVRSAADRRIGVLGMGEMGAAAAHRLAANGFSVSGWSRSQKRIDGVETSYGADGLTRVLRRADILVIVLPLTEATHGLISAAALAQMKHGASIINFGRGAIVDEAALLARLDEGALQHAVLDVFAVEPLPRASPLWKHERITILPHIAAPTNVETASRIAAENLRLYFRDGAIPMAVDRNRGY